MVMGHVARALSMLAYPHQPGVSIAGFDAISAEQCYIKRCHPLSQKGMLQLQLHSFAADLHYLLIRKKVKFAPAAKNSKFSTDKGLTILGDFEYP